MSIFSFIFLIIGFIVFFFLGCISLLWGGKNMEGSKGKDLYVTAMFFIVALLSLSIILLDVFGVIIE